MFALVDDIRAYPSFLPWCTKAEEHARSGESVEATLELQKGAISKRFTTRNALIEPESIDIELVDGPFRHLAGGWRFEDLGDSGCKVSLELEFGFDSRLVDMVFGRFFEDTCNSLVQAFTLRAETVFGSR